MSCAARHGTNVLCFECYRSRLDVPPERRLATVTRFPIEPRIPHPESRQRRGALSEVKLAHRRAMLVHLAATAASAGRDAASAALDEMFAPRSDDAAS